MTDNEVLRTVYQLDAETIKEIAEVVRRKTEYFKSEVEEWRHGRDVEGHEHKHYLTDTAFEGLVKKAEHYMKICNRLVAHIGALKPGA